MAAATSKRSDEYGYGTDAAELREFFLEYESRVGIRSANMESIYIVAVQDSAKPWACSDCRKDWWGCRCKHPVPRGERKPGEGPPPETTPSFAPSQNIGAHQSWDRYADIVPFLSASKRVYRALKLIDDCGGGRHLVVLWRLYGPHNHRLDEPAFGEFAALAEHTDAVEDARSDLACEISEPRAELVSGRVARAHALRRPGIEEEFWIAAGTIMKDGRRCDALAKHEASLARLAGLDPVGMSEKRRAAHLKSCAHHTKRAAEIRRKLAETAPLVQAADDFQGQLIDAFSCDGVIRATNGAITSTDRETTAADAIRWKLRAPPATMTPEERSAFTDERIRFVSRVKVQALELQKAAHSAYRDARRAVG